ncbi:MAG: hypothetical protein MMC23_005881 [Stictis urceolatum]|nr:hypothetical protein [Stictis urceolata]
MLGEHADSLGQITSTLPAPNTSIHAPSTAPTSTDAYPRGASPPANTAHTTQEPNTTPAQPDRPAQTQDGNSGSELQTQTQIQSREPPSPTSAQPSTKRRRKALACYDCRRRKLKCDRLWPACSRCIKAGQPNACRYDSIPSPAAGAAGAQGCHREESTSADEVGEVGPSLADAVHVLAPRQLGPTAGLVRKARGETGVGAGAEVSSKSVLQARRIERLEERVGRLEDRSVGAGGARAWEGKEAWRGTGGGEGEKGGMGIDMMFFKGKGVRTVYYGGSQPTSMISQFPELRSFMKDTILQYPSLARVQGDLRSLNSRAKTVSDARAVDASLLSLVPGKAATDRMVRLYLDTIEKLYRVVHVPTFQAEYTAFWEDPTQTKPDFVAMVLLMISCVISMSSESAIRFVGKSSVARERAITWTSAVESWLLRQSYKHMNLMRYQIMILVDISKHMNSIKKKRHWETAGNLLRYGLAVGLHRDPGLLIGKMTFYEDQMRRRLWATMVEWELQASITRGFPAQSASIPSDCPPPLNLDDESFGPGTVQAPPQKPAKEHTNTSFLHVAQQSLKLRKQLNSIVNDLTGSLSYEEVLSYEEKITHEIETIPSWDDDHLPGGGQDSYLLQTVSLDVQLRQFLIWLHFPFASRTDTRYSYSKTACFNAASTILDQHSKLMAQGEYTLCLLRNDGYLAALCICHNVFASSLLRSDIVFKSLNISFQQFAEEGLRMLEEKVMRLGECRNHHWFISAAYSFVLAKVAPETAHLTKQQAVDRATRLFYRILASQEEHPKLGSAGTLTPSLTASESTSNTGGYGPLQMQTAHNGFSAINTPQVNFLPGPRFGEISADHEQATDQAMQSLDPFEYFDLGEWALDNLWPIDNMEMY